VIRTTRDELRAAYTTVADSYDDLIPDTRFEAPIDLALVRHFLDLVGTGRSASILDAGCGAGRMMSYLERLDPTLDLTGADLAPGMVARARSRHPTRQIHEAELAVLPFADGQFDGLLSWYSIIHTPSTELPRVVAELARVLRLGGSLLVGFHAGTGERIARQAYGHEIQLRVQLHDPGEVRDVLSAGGFEVVAVLDRAARSVEKNAQGFLVAIRT
jgi:ubiquinone/menaquinone biosynthesis C-methylase UbiE